MSIKHYGVTDPPPPLYPKPPPTPAAHRQTPIQSRGPATLRGYITCCVAAQWLCTHAQLSLLSKFCPSVSPFSIPLLVDHASSPYPPPFPTKLNKAHGFVELCASFLTAQLHPNNSNFCQSCGSVNLLSLVSELCLVGSCPCCERRPMHLLCNNPLCGSITIH